MKIKRLYAENFRNIEGCDIIFSPGVNLFIGGDYIPAEWVSAPILDGLMEMPEALVAKGHEHLYLPMSWRLNLNFGLSLAFGSKHGR